MSTENKLRHLGFICDGDRRWARERGLPTIEGHTKGFSKSEMIIDALKETEVEVISFFLFSTENWGRSQAEVDYLMKLIQAKIASLGKKLMKENARFVVMGRPEPVDPKLWAELMETEQRTAKNTGKTVCICFNYGGQWEIVDAANRAIAAGKSLENPDDFAGYLYHPEVPPCDLIVRASGEQRISGFQLWRAAYSELLFLDKYFPALEQEDIEMILDEYHYRQRRFGK